MANALLFTAVAANLVLYSLVALWYLVPWTRRVSLAEALIPLALWHGLRTIGISFWLPTVTDPALPAAFADPAVIGDLVAAGLGIIVALLFKRGSKGAIAVAWAFNMWGFADLLFAFYNGITHDLAAYNLGPTWYIPTFVVPTMLVTHSVMFWLLFTRASEYQQTALRVRQDSRAAAVSDQPLSTLP